MRGSHQKVWLLWLLVAATPAFAQGFRLLAPEGVVSPDGFELAVVPSKDVTVTASGAQIKAQTHPSLGTMWFVVPDEGAREVTVTAAKGGEQKQASFVVGPPASRVELQLEPKQPVKGRDKDAQLTIKLLKSDGSVDTQSPPPVAQANVGKLEAPAQVEPGVYRARYVLPETGYPEVAVIVAFAPWPQPSSIHGAFGALRVPLATAFPLPGVAEKSSQMTMEIAGQKFGPVQVGADGNFQVDVVVPPGYRFAKGTAVDRAGNKRTSTLDLQLPPTDQLACVMNPRTLPADGTSRARILCAVSDPYGKAIANAKVLLQPKRGSATGPRAVGDLLEWIYVAPKPPSLEKELLSASWKAAGPLSREELEVTLQQGPASQLELEAAEPLVYRGSQVLLRVRAKDSFGRAREKATVVASAVPGVIASDAEVAPGEHELVLEMPEEVAVKRARVSARVFGPPGDQPSSMRAWREGTQLIVGVADLTGAPVPQQELEVGTATLVSGVDGTVRAPLPTPGASIDVRHKKWRGLSLRVFGLEGGGVFPESAVIGSSEAELPLRVEPPLPVNVRVTTRGREVTYWVEDKKGRVLPNRKVEIFLSAGTRGPEEDAKGGKRRFTVTSATPTSISVADAETGVTAVTVVRP